MFKFPAALSGERLPALGGLCIQVKLEKPVLGPASLTYKDGTHCPVGLSKNVLLQEEGNSF